MAITLPSAAALQGKTAKDWGAVNEIVPAGQQLARSTTANGGSAFPFIP